MWNGLGFVLVFNPYPCTFTYIPLPPQSLRKLSHPNIVKLREVIRENDELFFIFEYCETTVYSDMKDRSNVGKQFSEDKIRSMMYQVCSMLVAHTKKQYGYLRLGGMVR